MCSRAAPESELVRILFAFEHKQVTGTELWQLHTTMLKLLQHPHQATHGLKAIFLGMWEYRERSFEAFVELPLEPVEEETTEWLLKHGLRIWKNRLSDGQKSEIQNEYKSYREQGLLKEVLGPQ